MDDQQNTNQATPQFDLAAPPPPPGSVAPNSNQGQAPGTVVQPAPQQPESQDPTLTQLEQAVNESNQGQGGELPPPPFEQPVTNPTATQPMVVNDEQVLPQNNDNNESPVYDLPQAQPTTESQNTPESDAPPPPPSKQSVQANDDTNNELDIDESALDDVVQSQLQQATEEPSKPKKNWVDQIKSSTTSDDLDMIKQVALQELAPIANELDQAPKERFETLLQLIQATDNKDLVGPALEAAKAIEDSKDRAAALLDVVNEVNYLENKDKTQSEANEATAA